MLEYYKVDRRKTEEDRKRQKKIEGRQKKTEHFILYYLDTIFSIWISYFIYI